MGYKQDFIEFMVRSGVLCFGEFKTKSGRLSPYFINTGNYCTAAQASALGRYYAECIKDNLGDGFDAIYGPAYKGIPLAVSASISLYLDFGIDKPYTFNRKEAKDHGEGGSFIGYKPKDGDRIVIIDDVVTAGTSLRESLELLHGCADVQVAALVISVDRMERAGGEKTALDDIRASLGIPIFPIVTLDDIVETLYNREIDGRVHIDDACMEKIRAYRKLYGPVA